MNGECIKIDEDMQILAHAEKKVDMASLCDCVLMAQIKCISLLCNQPTSDHAEANLELSSEKEPDLRARSSKLTSDRIRQAVQSSLCGFLIFDGCKVFFTNACKIYRLANKKSTNLKHCFLSNRRS